MEPLRGEAGAINKSLLLIVILIALLGIAIIDGASLAFATLKLSDAVDSAASAAAREYRDTRSQKAAEEAAEVSLAEDDPDATIVEDSFQFNRQTYEVTLTATKQAPTVFIGKIGFLKGLAKLTLTSTGRPPEL